MSGIRQTRRVTFITEAGLYLHNDQPAPTGKMLKRWVTHEVLPGIRNPHSLRL
jgi:prophage antirepressor-like protein